MSNSQDREVLSRSDAKIPVSSDDDMKDGANLLGRNGNDDQDFDELPVTAYKNEIMDCILSNQIIICISETGRWDFCPLIILSDQILMYCIDGMQSTKFAFVDLIRHCKKDRSRIVDVLDER